MKIAREDLAYAAGIIDGEGSIYISRQRTPYKGTNPKHVGKVYDSYFARVAVSMVDDVTVPWLAKTFPVGSIHQDGKKIWRWLLATKDSESLLRLLYPHLKLKRPQAKIALRLCWLKRHIASSSRKGVLGAPLTRPAVQRQFGRWDRQLKALHARRTA